MVPLKPKLRLTGPQGHLGQDREEGLLVCNRGRKGQSGSFVGPLGKKFNLARGRSGVCPWLLGGHCRAWERPESSVLISLGLWATRYQLSLPRGWRLRSAMQAAVQVCVTGSQIKTLDTEAGVFPGWQQSCALSFQGQRSSRCPRLHGERAVWTLLGLARGTPSPG